MPRSGKIERRQTSADPIYQNPQVTKFINKIMVSGKKSLAQKIVYETFENIKKQGQDPIETFEKALDNIAPKMEVRPRRVGGASYMIPMEVRGSRRQSLALTWLVTAARNRSAKEVERLKNKPLMISKLTVEILEAAQGRGKAVSKREEMNRMAEANKAFAQFRW
ncbi:30S ribosomal protein S7 [Candidatus Curtissbacteria bacterium]|nr:30S ribosomal protein S7 [Candidatus Curtissbacteria bacterium]